MDTLKLELTPLEFDALGAFLQRTAPSPAEMLAHRVLLGKLEEALQRYRAGQPPPAPDEKPRCK